MGYFHIGYEFADCAWIKTASVLKQAECVRLVRFEDSIKAIIDGRSCNGVILKPQYGY